MRRLVIAAWVGFAGLTFLTAPTAPAAAAEPIEGRWSMGGGLVEFEAEDGEFVSRWIRQRPDILCPAIDDQDGDMRLVGSDRNYTGTWNWVLGSRDGRECRSLGRGPVTLELSADGQTARLEAEAPAGYSDHESHTLTRAPDGGLSLFGRLSSEELAAMPELVAPAELPAPAEVPAPFDSTELAAVPRLQQLPFQGRAPFVR
jgi:hypothetical protein